MDMQKLILVGRATKDAETISSKAGRDFTVFSIAVNRHLKGKDAETTFYDVVAFGTEDRVKKAAEIIKKGDRMLVIGRPEAEGYASKDGEVKARVKVIADEWNALK